MRIISGKYKNRKLRTLSNNIVRPTSASVRKSIFQILEPFDSRVVLDLFAGAGSLGIESLSRGAIKATFVEKNKRVINILSDNLKNLCDNCDNCDYSIINISVENYLKKCSQKYDLIFADPPYDTISFENLRSKVSKLLNYGGVFCMERRFEETCFEDVKIKNYGKTQFLIWEKI